MVAVNILADFQTAAPPHGGVLQSRSYCGFESRPPSVCAITPTRNPDRRTAKRVWYHTRAEFVGGVFCGDMIYTLPLILPS
ncbi:hypothetical protein FACS18949_15950 [Clostridia bacterium]|nr:hypothetical protein FACS189425_02350 [Clostridia bacterium]GHV36488.1 hypothetical protein FACS18949_15950 [Clostridia bacterium]